MKKVIIGIIIGLLILIADVYAGVVLSSDKLSYNDTTVKDALDNLFNDVENGKVKIAEAITNKGVNTLSTDSYDTIASKIDSISTGNPYLKYNEETGYIQVQDENGQWVNIYKASWLEFPLKSSLILFNYGSVSGYSWTAYQYASASSCSVSAKVNSDNISTSVVMKSNNVWCGYGYRSSQAIDVTAYNKMIVAYKSVNGYGYNEFGLSKSITISQTDSKNVTYGVNYSGLTNNSGDIETLTIDISSAEGQYYFHMYSSTQGSWCALVKIVLLGYIYIQLF